MLGLDNREQEQFEFLHAWKQDMFYLTSGTQRMMSWFVKKPIF